jgi:hypothetical protein
MSAPAVRISAPAERFPLSVFHRSLSRPFLALLRLLQEQLSKNRIIIDTDSHGEVRLLHW